MPGEVAPTVVRTESSEAAIDVPAGIVDVAVEDARIRGRWRFHVETPAALTIDFLAADPVDIAGATVLERATCDGFIPTPRMRVSVSGRAYEFVSSAGTVLERNYSRPDHQSVYVADRWSIALHEGRLRQCRRLLNGLTGSVLDVGSGYSMVHHTGPWPFSLCACDRDPSAVAALQRWGVDARLAAADDPPFEPGAFNALYAGEIIEHLPRPQAALRRWVELLKPHGRLIVTTPNRRHLLTRARRFEVVENPEHLFEWDLRQLMRAVTEAGAEVDTVEGLILPVPVYIPRRGWRDLTPTLLRHLDAVPARLVRTMVELGRSCPALAYNIAVSAHRTR